ncbi:MAG: AarF/UbiB family protein [Alphaproteobacteria bacterium]|nr:AarF/UbiB family protein [Alphaproteobacteria bacterium]
MTGVLFFFRGLWVIIRLRRVLLILLRSGLIAKSRPPDDPLILRLSLRFLHFIFYRCRKEGNESAFVEGLQTLGPGYVKLGQFFATRPDLIGVNLACALSLLHDRMPFFPREEAISVVETTFDLPLDELFVSFGDVIAAASVAQVHKACFRNRQGILRDVAVKILRPGIEDCFARDLAIFRSAAVTIDYFFSPARRLKLVSVVETLEKSVELEMDLRMDAAAMCEMGGNSEGDNAFRVPRVNWPRTGKRVLTMEWIDGLSLGDEEALTAAGHDRVRLASLVIQSFLRHATRDGFFHGDMHPGNLLVDKSGYLVAVDFGIMGRLGLKERRFLAKVLWGFIQRDYALVAEIHLEAGYVPRHHHIDSFAQALRAIGESLFGENAENISMARLLIQLFEVTRQFDMETRPELLLLQKSMLVVEGVARKLNPRFNMWTTADPVIREWIEGQLGAGSVLKTVEEGRLALNRFQVRIPELLDCMERIIRKTDIDLADKRSCFRDEDRSRKRESRIFWGCALSLIFIVLYFFL